MITRVAIDGDVIVYRSCCAAEPTTYHVYYEGVDLSQQFRYKKEYNAWLAKQPEDKRKGFEARPVKAVSPFSHAAQIAKTTLQGILKTLNPVDYNIFLTSDERTNFRYDLATIKEYKANRKDLERPTHYQELRDYLIEAWGAEVVDGEEADDALAQFQHEGYTNLFSAHSGSQDVTCIAAIDKDLLTVPGYNYDFVNNKLTWITKREADLSFYMQMLTGDASDNIPGLFHITRKKATKGIKEELLEQTTTYDMYEYVRAVYAAYLPCEDGLMLDEHYKKVDAIVNELGGLLYMRRYKGVAWSPPI